MYDIKDTVLSYNNKVLLLLDNAQQKKISDKNYVLGEPADYVRTYRV